MVSSQIEPTANHASAPQTLTNQSKRARTIFHLFICLISIQNLFDFQEQFGFDDSACDDVGRQKPNE